MGDSHLLPPGVCFFPSEEQIFCYYLAKKNACTEEENNFFGNDLIKELDLYEYDPYSLPKSASYAYGCKGRKRHWYCYSKVKSVKQNKFREAKNGYWRVRDVVVKNNNGGRLVLGTRTTLVFYLGNSLKNAARTDWVMHEYALVDHIKASFVVRRVFNKSSGGSSISEVTSASAAEESVSAVPHFGVQNDGFLIPDSSEGKLDDDNLIERRIDMSIYPVREASQLDVHVISRPVSDDGFQFPAGVSHNEQVSASGLTGTGLIGDAVATQQSQSILKEDFIELDDLEP